MKTLAIAVLFALMTFSAAAQQANLATPETISATNVQVKSFNVSRECVCATITVQYLAADSSVKREASWVVSNDGASTDLNTFLTAIGTARANETGTVPRRMNFRVLGYLVDSGRLSGVTLVP
jgi:hypothetical protein